MRGFSALENFRLIIIVHKALRYIRQELLARESGRRKVTSSIQPQSSQQSFHELISHPNAGQFRLRAIVKLV